MVKTTITRACDRCGAPFTRRMYVDRPQQFCSPACYRNEPIEALAERLTSQITRLGTDDCWLWTGHVNNMGYGQLSWRGRHVLTHRAAWELAHGPIPHGLNVLHRCDTPRCCNPQHLFLGTKADNTHDALHKGRLSHGEQRWNAKLTESTVRAIRAATGTHAAIAATFGVSQANVSRVRLRQTWQHVV